MIRRHFFFSISILLSTLFFNLKVNCQENALTNTSNSPYAQLKSVDFNDIKLTEGFWAERLSVCEQSMVPHMLEMYFDDEISHGFANFEIAAGLKEGEHVGPPFHDGDFYKLLEALIVVNSIEKNIAIDAKIDSVIHVISMCQREDGYIHTPVIIEQNKDTEGKKEFGERLDFETYNLGHLMTVACLHYRTTGKTELLDIAKKATDFLYKYYKSKPEELAKNAICPSHYMGVIEMYRTTKEPRYLELSKALIDIRSMVEDGTDHNQDRIDFRKQTEAIGHAVRANYLYAGVADVFLETGDSSLLQSLDAIWNDLVNHKLYITGACGALYDGVSPNGTTYNQSSIQQVHQAYGEDYELPNTTAHNESCANIGNLLWNWRMLQLSGDAKYADLIEQIMYNSLLAAVSLDGKRHFYTNPLSVTNGISEHLRWSKEREEYISYCNCCPPNTIRTIAEIQNYFYGIDEKGIWFHQYGGNELSTNIAGYGDIELTQTTNYPWEGNISIEIKNAEKKELSISLRIPKWTNNATIKINGSLINEQLKPGTYTTLNKKWKKGDVITVDFPMKTKLIQTNQLVENNRNQVAVQRGPVVYCLESDDLPKDASIYDIILPKTFDLKPQAEKIENSQLMTLFGEALLIDNSWDGNLYREVSDSEPQKVKIKLVPYYAWGNRSKGEMMVWLPFSR